jgi:hypothetical protein
MKKYIVALIAVGAAASVLAQGTVSFVNSGTGVKAPVYGVETPNNTVSKTGNTTAGNVAGTQVYTGALLNGSGFVAQLYAAAGGGVAEGSLQAATPTTTFRTGSAAGFLAIITTTLAGVPLDAALATVQVRAWDNSSGQYATWAAAEAAWNAGTIAAGKSKTWDLAAIGGQANTPPILKGMESFNLYMKVIPEPSTFALLGLGALGMMIFRRK